MTQYKRLGCGKLRRWDELNTAPKQLENYIVEIELLFSIIFGSITVI